VQIETYHNVQLSDGELKILALISTRLCMATAEKYQYRSIKAELECGDNIFTASGTTVVEPGWKKYDAALRSEYKVRMEKEDEELKSLPPLTE
jgi:DNA topoisomerase-3